MELRPLPRYPDYHAGADGHIYSTRPWRGSTDLRRLRSGTDTKGKGYQHVSLPCPDARSGYRPYLVHRLVCEAWHGPPPPEADASHRDDDKRNNVPSNLLWESRAHNIARKVGNGIDDAGHRNSRASLTEPQVREIRRLLDRGVKHQAIADRFGVARTTVTKINRGFRYSH